MVEVLIQVAVVIRDGLQIEMETAGVHDMEIGAVNKV